MTTILLIEDNPTDILLIQRAFRNMNLPNVSLVVVKDGDTAVLYLSGSNEYADRYRFPLPAIILLDLKLPRRSGHEILAWLRQESELRYLPVVILTSSREKIDVNQAYELGVNSYLIKPVKLNDFSHMMHTFSQYWLDFNISPNNV